jgi:hypothetical protein
VHAAGVAVDVAWQRTRTQQWLLQQWESCSFLYGPVWHNSKAAFSMGSVPRLYNEDHVWALKPGLTDRLVVGRKVT